MSKQSRRLQSNWQKLLIAVGLVLLVGSRLSLAQKDIAPVESVLDRLEKRLMDQQADGLTFGEKSFLNEKASESAPRKALPKVKGNSTQVPGDLEESTQLREIGKSIADLESQVDQLSSEVLRTKQRVLDEAKIDNFFAIEVFMSNTEATALRSLRVKLDGFEVYALSDDASLWLPANTVPVFAGPLQTGAHRLDVEMKLASKAEGNVPLNTEVFRLLSQSFPIDISDGLLRQKYQINVEIGPDSIPSAKITNLPLKEYVSVSKADSKVAPSATTH